MKSGDPPGKWLRAERDRLAGLITSLQYERTPALAQRYGEAGRAKCEADAAYHLDFLITAVERQAPQLFIEYVSWARTLLDGLSIDVADLQENLGCLRETLVTQAPQSMHDSLTAVVDAGLDTLTAPQQATNSFIPEHGPCAAIARRYLNAMLAGDRRQAVALILESVSTGTSIQDLYLQVFEPVQHEIGRLWQINQISVAEEHYCTAITQLCISQLYSSIQASPRKGHTMVAICAHGDLHEIGIRVLCDLFELDGWDAHYLGASVPLRGTLPMVYRRRPDLIAISATMAFNVEQVAELITLLRQDEQLGSKPILVGGYPFKLQPDLWRTVGADAYAARADEGVLIGNRLLGNETA